MMMLDSMQQFLMILMCEIPTPVLIKAGCDRNGIFFFLKKNARLTLWQTSFDATDTGVIIIFLFLKSSSSVELHTC